MFAVGTSIGANVLVYVASFLPLIPLVLHQKVDIIVATIVCSIGITFHTISLIAHILLLQ